MGTGEGSLPGLQMAVLLGKKNQEKNQGTLFPFLKRQIITGGLLGGNIWQLGNM